ncbi:unnamed protein product [Adineta ricciae]|uniref:Cullin family profile domain-containing protein n=1 Tax=Adineta ricciae TaxID=249248 RepID=A0A815K7I9_ADIRI|nr:unnamed protein product [Adineta ricciae]CAF1387431.1 unnamed protein product [Adineta ricciae]
MANASQLLPTANVVWNNLLDDIEHLFQYQTIRYSKWMALYTNIFDYCTKRTQSSDNHILYQQFEEYLENYLERFCQSALQSSELNFLECYINQWQRFCRSSKILHGICSYFHRSYVHRERNSGNDRIQEIYPLAMQMWQNIACRTFHTHLAFLCLNMIHAERQHQVIDRELLRSVIQTHILFDADKSRITLDTDENMLNIYQEYFEEQFLYDTIEFYRSEITKHLQEQSTLEYILKIPQYIDEEVYRATFYLHPSTIEKLIKSLEQVFICDQLTIIYSEAKILVHDEDISNLKHLYQIIMRVKPTKVELKEIVDAHIYQTAIERIQRISPLSTIDLHVYIETIHNLHDKYLVFCQKSFDNDSDLINVFHRTCRRFINDNVIVRAMGNARKMSEHLAYYCDRILRKTMKKETTGENIFPQIKTLIYYIFDKDIFIKLYARLLAKRLLNQSNVGIEHEKLMVSYIEDTCGYMCTLRMVQMCRDIETSVNVLCQYHKHCQEKQFSAKIKFDAMILKSESWSFSKAQNIILPYDFNHIIDYFTNFYNCVYSGRKLIWLHQQSKGELQRYFQNRMYTFQVSVYQLIILLLFNNFSEYSVKRIQEETQIQLDTLLQILNVLFGSNILTLKKSVDQQKLHLDSIVQLREDYTSDKLRVNLNIPEKSVEQNDAKAFQTEIDHDRTMMIQATIVRIMKQNVAMDENLLIQKVIEQLTSYSNVDVSVITKCVKILIEKEYLEQHAKQTNILLYKA